MRIVLSLMVGIGELFASALVLMWLVSAVHDWWPLVPLISYGQAALLSAITGVLLAVSHAAKKIVEEIG